MKPKTRKAKTWAELPRVAQKDLLMLMECDRERWNGPESNWDPNAWPFVVMRRLAMTLAIKELRRAMKVKP